MKEKMIALGVLLSISVVLFGFVYNMTYKTNKIDYSGDTIAECRKFNKTGHFKFKLEELKVDYKGRVFVNDIVTKSVIYIPREIFKKEYECRGVVSKESPEDTWTPIR